MMRHRVAKVLLASALAFQVACSSGDGAQNGATGGAASGGTSTAGGGSGVRQAAADRQRARPAGSGNSGTRRRAFRRRRSSRGRSSFRGYGGYGRLGDHRDRRRRRRRGRLRRRWRCHRRLRRHGRWWDGRVRPVSKGRQSLQDLTARRFDHPWCQIVGRGGYRSQLFKLVVAANQKVAFTGSLSNGPTQVSGQPFSRMHEGTLAGRSVNSLR